MNGMDEVRMQPPLAKARVEKSLDDLNDMIDERLKLNMLAQGKGGQPKGGGGQWQGKGGVLQNQTGGGWQGHPGGGWQGKGSGKDKGKGADIKG